MTLKLSEKCTNFITRTNTQQDKAFLHGDNSEYSVSLKLPDYQVSFQYANFSESVKLLRNLKCTLFIFISKNMFPFIYSRFLSTSLEPLWAYVLKHEYTDFILHYNQYKMTAASHNDCIPIGWRRLYSGRTLLSRF